MTGLVIGKFYPPHKGHSHLIKTAGDQVDRLVVIVCQKDGQIPPANLRASWLKQIHPQTEVYILDQSKCNDLDPNSWTQAIQALLGFKVDVLFTSEDYGGQYAPLLGARHVMVDRHRTVYPCSGSEIRANPIAHLNVMEDCVQEYYLHNVSKNQ